MIGSSESGSGSGPRSANFQTLEELKSFPIEEFDVPKPS
jgi:hypothetical protein